MYCGQFAIFVFFSSQICPIKIFKEVNQIGFKPKFNPFSKLSDVGTYKSLTSIIVKFGRSGLSHTILHINNMDAIGKRNFRSNFVLMNTN